MPARATIYICDGMFYVPTIGAAEVGWVDIEPILKAEAEGLAEALRSSLARGNPEAPSPGRDPDKALIVKATGSKKWRDFEKRALSVTILCHPDHYEIIPMIKNKLKRWSFNHEQTARIPIDAGLEGVAQWAASYLKSHNEP